MVLQNRLVPKYSISLNKPKQGPKQYSWHCFQAKRKNKKKIELKSKKKKNCNKEFEKKEKIVTEQAHPRTPWKKFLKPPLYQPNKEKDVSLWILTRKQTLPTCLPPRVPSASFSSCMSLHHILHSIQTTKLTKVY